MPNVWQEGSNMIMQWHSLENFFPGWPIVRGHVAYVGILVHKIFDSTRTIRSQLFALSFFVWPASFGLCLTLNTTNANR